MKDDQAPADWVKSSFSGNDGACVELATLPDGHGAVRDSKLGAMSPVLAVPASSFGALIDGIKTGQLG